mgnify:CR=1 FL=1
MGQPHAGTPLPPGTEPDAWPPDDEGISVLVCTAPGPPEHPIQTAALCGRCRRTSAAGRVYPVVRAGKNARLTATFQHLIAQADDGESGKTAKSERHIWILEHWDNVVPYHFSTDSEIPFGS